MKLMQKLAFTGFLIEEVIDEVLTNIGSPPFPDLATLEALSKDLNDYIADNVTFDEDGGWRNSEELD